MNHDDAMKMMAAERYILGELESSERDAFEEHFFECRACADDVRDSAKFAAGVRTSDARVVPIPGRFNWWAAAASLLMVALGYDRFIVMPQMAMHVPAVAAMRLAVETVVLDSPSRGPGDNVVVVKVRRDEAVPFTTAIPAKDPYPVYICEIQDSSGHVLASLRVTRAEANDPVSLVVAPGILTSGNYKLVIRGGDREIAAYPFTMEVR
jgi:hypothetical protein